MDGRKLSTLYKNIKVKPCNILGFLSYEVCSENENITIGAFMYEKDAELFKKAIEKVLSE